MLVGCASAPGDAPSTNVASARASAYPVTAGSSAVVATVPASSSASASPPPPPPPVASPPALVPRSTRKCGADPVEVGGWVEVPAATFTKGKVTDRARLARHLKKPDDVLTSLVYDEPVVTKVGRFWIGRAEVTVGEYARCVAAGACAPLPKREGCGGAVDLPANCVGFHQAERYCEATGARLPSEAEWELAARGPEGRLFAWGDEPDEAAFGGPTRVPVGTCRVRDTPTGIHDIAGNGREWTSTGKGNSRVSKGIECWLELSCFAFNGVVDIVEAQHDYQGFRCARDDGPGPEKLAFVGRPSGSGVVASAPATPRKVHWSTLIDSFAEAKGPVSAETICFVDVGFDGDGRATSARAVDVARPDQPACPPALRSIAEKAARTVKVAAHEGGVETTLPVRITR
jgi:formylglycine-generating enzyme required for sulfatase activity